jgi:hypothetical protein
VNNPVTQDPNFSDSKFHRLFGKCLSVALEATFPLDVDLTFPNGAIYNNELIYTPSPDAVRKAYAQGQPQNLRRRVYHPALEEGDLTKQDAAAIKFVPWVDDAGVQFYRMLFRLRPLDGGGGKAFRWMQFGRSSEDKPFSFNPQDPKKCFIYLDLMSKTSEFKPVYIKVQKDTKDFCYFVVEVEVSADGVAIKARKVAAQEVPLHLSQAMPA